MRFYAQGYKVFDWIKTFRAMQHENSPESQEWSWFSMLDNHPDVLSFRQVMEITHIGRNLLLRLLNSGEIPAFKMGKLWKVYKQDLIQYMSQCQWALSFVWGKKNPVGLRSRNLAGFDSTGFITNAMLNSTIKNFFIRSSPSFLWFHHFSAPIIQIGLDGMVVHPTHATKKGTRHSHFECTKGALSQGMPRHSSSCQTS